MTTQDKHCMFQYATSYKYIGTKIHKDTDLITWKEALNLWNKYKSQFISELEDGAYPEMVIWTGCEDNTSYAHDAFHVDRNTQIKDGEFVEVTIKVIDPNKVKMGAPIFKEQS